MQASGDEGFSRFAQSIWFNARPKCRKARLQALLHGGPLAGENRKKRVADVWPQMTNRRAQPGPHRGIVLSRHALSVVHARPANSFVSV